MVTQVARQTPDSPEPRSKRMAAARTCVANFGNIARSPEPGRKRMAAALLAALALVLVPALAASAQAGQATPDVRRPAASLVAVAPFANAGGASRDDWIGGGLVETLRFAFPRLVHLDVGRTGRESAAILRMAGAAGVSWLLAGDYERVGDSLSITVRVVDVGTGETVESATVGGAADELFLLQDRIVDRVAAALAVLTKPGRMTSAGPATAPRVPAGELEARAVAKTATAETVPAATPPEAVLGAGSRPGAEPRLEEAVPGGGPPPTAPRLPSLAGPAGATRIHGPPPPVAPEVIARDDRGRATMRAVRLAEPLTLDGALDERVYRDVPPVTGFFQVLPNEGEIAEEQTEVWVLFDGVNFYISGRCHNSAPESEWVADDMRRDGQGIGQYFGIVLDTFYDRRNAVSFLVNPLGGRMDGEVTNERAWNGDWNPVWSARVGRYDGGWSFEMAIPFRSLRYRPGRAQTWGLNLERYVVRNNEYSTIVPMQASWGLGASMQISEAATLVGVEVPAPGVNLEVKPYAIAEGSGVRAGGPGLSNDATGDAGLDVKYAITENLVADFTLNTDFAQVEADEQQINLTRFSLFFPEKREFFLENQGVFSFGAEAGAGQFAGISNQPILFYSRQIGLHSTADGLSREVPITAGGRVSGRIGRFSVGMLNMQTGDLTATAGGAPGSGAPATNFSVLRLRRDILRRSNVGVMYTGRSDSLYGTGSNQAYGVDGLFSFFQNLNVNTYWAETRTPGAGFGDDQASYRGQLDYTGDRYGVRLERLSVGRDFSPEIGFLRRRDFDESLAMFRFSPRPRSIAAIRQFFFEGQIDYITNRAGVLETRQSRGRFGMELERGDLFDVVYNRNYEYFNRPFPVAGIFFVPAGAYDFDEVEVGYAFGRQNRLAGRLWVQHGGFYGGAKTSVNFGMGQSFFGSRLQISPQLSFEPTVSYNRIDIPAIGPAFTTGLVSTRAIYAFNPLMFFSGLVQYNSAADAVGLNLRLRWEYSPGSELFVVYNEERYDTMLRPQRFPQLQNRALIVKINRLFRF